MKKKTPTRADASEFYAILSENKFMHVPTRVMVEAAVVDKLCGKKTSDSLIKEMGCFQLTWAPGLPEVIKDKAIVGGSWRDTPGQMTFNWYLPPDPPRGGDPEQAGPWLDLSGKLWGRQADHMIDWLAHRVQHPAVKINHGLVLGSDGHGIGKDSWLYPVGHAVGRWNWRNISAGRAFKQADDFNAFLESVIVHISEAHDLGEKRFAFYDKMKDWCAAPPVTLEVADKHVKAHPVANVVGPIITTNHKTDGLYIPPEDRRLYVAWSDLTRADFGESYWNDLYRWYEEGGCEHVAAYLLDRDLSLFDPKAPPPKTEAWHAIVAASAEPQDGEMQDALDIMGDASDLGEPDLIVRPKAITIASVRAAISRHGRMNDFHNFLGDARNRRKIQHRIDGAGFTPVPNPDRKDGLWRVGGVSQMVYADKSLADGARYAAVVELVRYEGAKVARARRAHGRASAAEQEAV